MEPLDEMEGAAVAQVCIESGTPYAIVRAISDDGSADEFEGFLQHESATYARGIISRLLTLDFQGRPLRGFRRRNCCLIYRLSPGRPAYCGDCVLVGRSGSARGSRPPAR